MKKRGRTLSVKDVEPDLFHIVDESGRVVAIVETQAAGEPFMGCWMRVRDLINNKVWEAFGITELKVDDEPYIITAWWRGNPFIDCVIYVTPREKGKKYYGIDYK